MRFLLAPAGGGINHVRTVVYARPHGAIREESPDTTGQDSRRKPGHGASRDGKCHRKQTAPRGVRVKRWGKSPPLRGRPRRHGKPNPVQDKQGPSSGRPPRTRVVAPPQGGSARSEKWTRRGSVRAAPDRIRLTVCDSEDEGPGGDARPFPFRPQRRDGQRWVIGT